MQSKASTPEAYIAELPADRKASITTLRKLILKSLPQGYEEGMLYGMLSYYIPLQKYPDTYNKQPLCAVALASQKNYMSLYLLCAYSESKLEKMIQEGFAKDGKKLNMGKSCVRFKSLDELSLPTIEKAIAAVSVEEFIKMYEKSRATLKK